MNGIEKRIEQAENLLKEIRAELAKCNDSSVERVRGQIYFFVASGGEVGSTNDQIASVDDWRWLTGNYFLTKQATCDYRKFLTIQGKVREIARRFPPCDWENEIQKKWCLKYSFPTVGVVDSFWTSLKASSVIHCSSPEFLDICLSEIGKDDLDFYCKYEV